MNVELISRPRWGTFSVIDHEDVAGLVPEILLYDRLVFPVPAGDDERWEEEDWRPDLLRQRLDELGELAHGVAWTEELQEDWADGMREIGDVGNEVDGLGYDMTPNVLAMSGWGDRVPPPVPIAAFRNPETARLVYRVRPLEPLEARRQELHRRVGAFIERKVAMPIAEDPEATYLGAIELARNEKFQRARRALYDWEDERAADGWPTEAAIRELEELVDGHNALIRDHFRRTWLRRTYHVVAFGAGVAVEAAGMPFLGLGVTGGMELISARFPILTAKGHSPDRQPAAALQMAISALAHE